MIEDCRGGFGRALFIDLEQIIPGPSKLKGQMEKGVCNLKNYLAAMALVVWSASAAAVDNDDFDLDTMRDLADVCGATLDDQNARAARNFCHGFIAGSGLLYAELIEASVIDRWACPAETPSLDEIRVAFVMWAEANPEHDERSATDSFWRAMAATWPCDE